MLRISKIDDLTMAKVQLSSKGGLMAARLVRQLHVWKGFALLTFTIRLGEADDTGRLRLDWDDIPNLILKKKLLPRLIRKFQGLHPGLFGRYYLKPEVESNIDKDDQFHVHVLLEVRPPEARPKWGSVPRPIMTEMAAMWHPFGDLNVRPGARLKHSINRVATYFCKSDALVGQCYEEWELCHKFVIPSRCRPGLDIPAAAPLVDPRIRRG